MKSLNMKTRKASTLATFVALVSIASASNKSYAALVVVPGAQAAVEGNSDNGYPFNIDSASMRYQQGYAASQFSSLAGPSWITQIAFRPDAPFGAVFATTFPSIQINLSTTTQNPNALSSTFASNVGGNDTVVFGLGALSLSSGFTGPAGGPKAFDIVITLTTPFLYNPADGNLLLDVRNYGGGAYTTQFDASTASTDGVSRGWYYSDVNAASGTTDTGGLITRFTFEPVPEPSTYLAGALLLLPFGMHGIRYLGNRKPK
jgi:hypothetical protein